VGVLTLGTVFGTFAVGWLDLVVVGWLWLFRVDIVKSGIQDVMC
jgi:hypothetical protein